MCRQYTHIAKQHDDEKQELAIFKAKATIARYYRKILYHDLRDKSSADPICLA
ncbi:MAG: hypothetical protein Q4G13_00905 [Moraxella sp.]|nr:hypothetical protein [Moraxella sp.]